MNMTANFVQSEGVIPLQEWAHMLEGACEVLSIIIRLIYEKNEVETAAVLWAALLREKGWLITWDKAKQKFRTMEVRP